MGTTEFGVKLAPIHPLQRPGSEHFVIYVLIWPYWRHLEREAP